MQLNKEFKKPKPNPQLLQHKQEATQQTVIEGVFAQ